VAWKEGRFVWTVADLASPEAAAHLRRFFPPPSVGNCYEANLEALTWIGRISRALESGWVISIDHGYTEAEAVRFPRGRLMSYRRDTASGDVLADAGERDITAHVNFSALKARGEECGTRADHLETLAETLIAGEEEFAERLRCRMPPRSRGGAWSSKHCFGMEETFRISVSARTGSKSEGKARNNEKGPGIPGPWNGTLPFFRACPSYFFFFGAAFFLGAAFLVALFID
jgi:hypothetical protein